MRNALPREAYADRPEMDSAEAVSEIRLKPDTLFRMDSEAFIGVMRERFGFKITRRTLQLYSSPLHRLLPPPVHMGGHTSYYLHPEHTERLAAILHLRERLLMPLKAIRTLLRGYPERHYGVLLQDVLTVQDLKQMVEHFEHGFELKDFLFHKIIRVFRALNESEEPERLQGAEERERVLGRMAHEFEKWLHSERRERVEGWLSERKRS